MSNSEERGQGRQERLPAEQALERVIAQINSKLPDFVREIRSESHPLALKIHFAKDENEIRSYELRIFLDDLRQTLSEHNLELGRISGASGGSTSYCIVEKTINGRTNWRRWVHYPTNCDPKAAQLLDKIALSVGQQRGHDSYDKFDRFIQEGLDKQIISEEEFEIIKSQKYKMANA